ncbi:PD-(D/E)XK nuclease family protein [Candidatus Riflebacteria bacterium]
MNIFEILSSGRSGVTENHVNAFLAWILDPNQTHGLRHFVLGELLQLIEKKLSETSSNNKGFYNNWGEGLNEGLNLEKRTSTDIDVILEKPVKSELAKQVIDVVVEKKLEGQPQLILSIENKVRSTSVTKGQLHKQYQALLSEYKEEQVDGIGIDEKNIFLLQLLPEIKNDEHKKAWIGLSDEVKSRSCTLPWIGEAQSFSNILVDALVKENQAQIPPFPEITKYLLKSIVAFARNGFRKTKTNISTQSGQGKYDELLEGIPELIEKYIISPEGYIGYNGGLTQLGSDIEKKSDYVENRRYKWVLERSGSEKQWPSLEEFKNVLTKYNLWKIE